MITSPGEALWYHLRYRFIEPRYRSEVSKDEEVDWADPAGRLRRYAEEALVSASCTRLISKARRHLKQVVPAGSATSGLPYQESTIDAIKQFCVDPLGMSFSDRYLARFASLAFDSAVAAGKNASPATRRSAFRDAASRAGGRVVCYLCATMLGRWDMFKHEKALPLDHLWPQAFGGVSEEENLLPICDACNGLKKDRITWDVYGTVHDYALRLNTADGLALTKLALHRRAATKLAENKHISLKEAFMLLGPYQDLASVQSDEPDWFFNQVAHSGDVLQELW